MSHCEIETEFDNMLLRRDGHDPMNFFTASHIHPAGKCPGHRALLRGHPAAGALDALKGMIAVHRLLQAPTRSSAGWC